MNHRARPRQRHRKARRRLERRHKMLFHFALIVLIGVAMVHEGAQYADLGFLGLAILVEVA